MFRKQLHTLFGSLMLFVFFIPSEVSASGDSLTRRGFVRLDYENDFFNATDRYYTQGVKLEIVNPLFLRSPLRYIFLSFKGGAHESGVFVMQECFTPSSIRRDTVFTGDRPFAACLYMGQRMMSIDTAGTHRLSSSFIVGFLGPRAGGRETQVNIHKWLNNIEPLGWQYQVSNDIVINYSAAYDKLLLQRRNMELQAGAGLRAGTLYDNAGVSFAFSAGRLDPVFNPLQKNIHKKFRCFATIWSSANVVAYNATLQGGMFNKNNIYTISPADVQRLLISGGLRGVIAFKRLRLEYSRTWSTSEFAGGLPHGWGGVHIMISY
jgi:hypothetical protein